MGTKVQIENYLPGHYSMRDLSHESNGASWPSCYGDGNLPNGQFYYGFLQRTVADSHPGYDKDAVKQTMLEHEAVFKNQVYELHRLYRVQRDLMDEVRRKEQFKQRIPYEASSSSSPVPSQMQSEDVQRWNGSSLPLANSACGRPLISVPDAIQSSPNSVKGKSIQAGPSLFQNCYSPKNSEVSESRPTKFRRRMLDLQLPADEYIDTDEVEQFAVAKDFGSTSPSPYKNANSASTNGKMFLIHPAKSECQGDASRSDLHISKPKALADLNEPLHVEETTISSADFLGRASNLSDVQYMDLPTRLSSSSKDVPHNPRNGSLNGTLNHLNGNRINGQDWFYALEPEQHKGSIRSINQGHHPEKMPSSQPVHVLLDQACRPPAFLASDHIKREPWKEKPGVNIEKIDRSYSLSGYNIPEPILASQVSNQPSLFHPSDLSKSWDQSASSWGKANSLMSQKLMSVQASPYYSSLNLSKSPQSSAQSNDLFGNKWNLNSIPGAGAAFGSEPPVRNGFYQGSSAGFKEAPYPFPPAGFEYVNCNYSERTVLGSSNSYLKGTNCTEVNPMREMNLNVALPNGVFDNHINTPGPKIIDKNHKSQDPLAVLPWLRGKGDYCNEAEKSRKGANSLDSVPLQGAPVTSSSCEIDTKAKKPESSKKILGVPIFENPLTPKRENPAFLNSSAKNYRSGNEEIECSKRKRVFDINIACEPTDSELEIVAIEEVVVVEKKTKTESVSLRNNFDLNSCLTEEEMPRETTFPDNSTSMKVGTGIDLEAPVILEDEDVILPDEGSLAKEPEKQLSELQPGDTISDGEAELAKSAAAAIVAISSFVNVNRSTAEETTCTPTEADIDDPLHWFVDIACSSGNDLECQMVLDRLPEGLDDFESMILRLQECSFDEYFPKPSIPEFPIVENSTCVLTTRTRKGQARRGRQRRDFQRDILPGLTTLSRHEVTEDLQTFGGLMRATGHPWHSGPNRRNATRNGCARGRRRAVAAAPVVTNTVCPLPPKQQQQQQNNNPEVGLEDRSLTGWGKTTRRPRRQRCPAGNPAPPVPLT